ncbi:MAG: FAD binding domain-containing protein [Chloroflexi bacterium]|nr:FAD binding domain-containing protein [Chloroflexota bacterium]
MKPASFEYYAPTNVDEALARLAELGYGVKVLAGGQSLVPSMNFRLAQPPALLDLNNVQELFYIRPTSDGGVAIGTMTRDSQVEHDALIKEKFPIIAAAMHFMAHPQIRNRGTFGGAIAHADPTAQLPAVVLALNGRMRIRSQQGERWVAAEEFFVGPFTSVLEPEELLVEVELPPTPAHSGWSYRQMERQAGAQALVGVAVMVSLDEAGKCRSARIAFLSVGETAVLARQAAQMLTGQKPTAELIHAAAETAANVDIEPGGDIHCSVEYRRHLAEVLARQALTEAFERAGR